MKLSLRVDRLHLKLSFFVSTVVIGALGTGFFVSYWYYKNQSLEMVRDHATLQGALIRAGVEHGMLRDDHELVQFMLSEYADEQQVERVMIVDRLGEVLVSSDPTMLGHVFSLDDAPCQTCHVNAPELRTDALLLDVDGAKIFRSVQPIENRPACHGCHDEEYRINGVLLVDSPVDVAHEDLERTAQWLAFGTGFMGTFVLGGIAFAFRRLILRRLFRLQRVARAIADGELEERVPEEGRDAITDIEVQFNLMADSVVGLLARVEEQHARLENIMNSVDDGLVVLDHARRIVAVNKAFERRYGSNLVGLFCCGGGGFPNAGLCDPDGETAHCLVAACFSAGQPGGSLRTVTGPDGKVRYEEVRTSPVRSADGTTGFVVETWRDITDRRSAEARLADYQRMASLGMLASGFSHEINTPLASIGTCLDGIGRILASVDPESSDQLPAAKEYTSIAISEVQRCGAITRQFLQLARGKSLEKSTLDLDAEVRQVVRLASPTARQQGVALVVEETAPDDYTVVANASSVQQVLLNLILNAVEASASGQAVTIAVGAERDLLSVAVSDQGGGISAEHLPHVFEPFFSRRPGGTGLGLFVSHNMAQTWDGEIAVTNIAGTGARFTVTFPRIEVDDEHGARRR